MSQQNSIDKDFIMFAGKASKLIDEGKLTHALNLSEAGVRRFPAYAPGHYILGICYEANGQSEEAKNEFERTLVYDPAHTKALQRLVHYYESNNLKEVSNDLLLNAAYYNPLHKELIEEIKTKGLYDKLNPESVSTVETEVVSKENDLEAVAEPLDVLPEIEEETGNTQELKDESDEIDSEEEKSADEKEDTLEQLIEEGDTAEIEDLPAIEKLDPLSANVQSDEKDDDSDEESRKPRRQDLSQYANLEDDFSTIMEGYFDKDEPAPEIQETENEDWIEVENLLLDEELPVDEDVVDEQEISEDEPSKNIDPMGEENQDETELLLEELSSSDEDAKIEEALDNEKQLMAERAEDFLDSAESDDTILIVDGLGPADSSETEKPRENLQKESAEKSDKEEQVELRKPFEFQTVKKEPSAESVVEEEVTIKDLMENPNLVTPTFGEILIAQRKFSEARHVFLELAKREPENIRLQKKIEFLDRFLEAQNSI